MAKTSKPSLAETHPELAAQADGWDPTTVRPGSHQILAWRCPVGHSWDAQVKSRALNENGCPYCSGFKAQSGVNDLATTHPDLAKQADGWDPTTVTSQTHKSVNWKCSLGHKWISNWAIEHRVLVCAPQG